MHVSLSADEVCSKMRTVSLERRSRKTVKLKFLSLTIKFGQNKNKIDNIKL